MNCDLRINCDYHGRLSIITKHMESTHSQYMFLSKHLRAPMSGLLVDENTCSNSTPKNQAP